MVEKKKYYFISSMYQYYMQSELKPQHEVTAGVHPFERIAHYEKTLYDIILLSWQEITKEEYDLYLKLQK